ncbi:MAG: hypothetical protein DDT26_02206 [Dehalococcoidia bacterium]|nr:hypothetical protein [Chloroflexota bacterium]MBT9166293.1 hypothetical protein [Chloroflexota bacterium]
MNFKSRFLLFIAAVSISVSAGADGIYRQYVKSGEQTFGVKGGDVTRKLKLPVHIVDWRIDCSESRAVIWGQPKKNLRLGAPPYAVAYVVDINRLQTLSTYSMTRGPYDAEFSADRKRIVIDEILIEFDTGDLVKDFRSEDFLFERELCADFPGRRLLQ